MPHPASPAAIIAVGSLLALCAPAAHAAQGCDRTCLSGALDGYLTAIYKHDPTAVRLAANFKSTENAAVVMPGQGLWQTATGPGTVQRRYLDPQSGQAALIGTLMEGDKTDIVSLRLKVANRRPAEAEWTIARATDGMFSVDGFISNPPPDQTLPASDRTPRAQMVAVTDSYFQALQDHDGSKVAHVSGCERIENGVKVTNRTGPMPAVPGGPRPPAGGPPGGAPPGAAVEMHSGDCVAGFDHFLHTIKSVDLRRYPVVDTQKGVVLGEVLFHRFPGATLKRNLLNEYFWVKGGKLTVMYAAMHYLPADAPDTNGWE